MDIQLFTNHDPGVTNGAMHRHQSLS